MELSLVRLVALASTGDVRALPESEVFGIRGMIPEGRRDENFRLQERKEGAEKRPFAMRILWDSPWAGTNR